MDMFKQKNILPMRIKPAGRLKDSSNYIYELNLSGVRCIAYLDEHGTDLRDSHNHQLLPLLPELSNLHRSITRPCILDGELIVLDHGVPDPAALYDRFTIPLKHNPDIKPVTYVAFDLLYLDSAPLTHLPLSLRKSLLDDFIIETVDLTIARFQDVHPMELMETAKSLHLDGIIAKQKTSLYLTNQCDGSWLHYPIIPTGYYVLGGYVTTSNEQNYFLFGQYNHEFFYYQGKVPAKKCMMDSGMNHYMSTHELDFSENSPFLLTPVFPENSKVLWFQPQLVCRFELPSVSHQTLKHAVFLGITTSLTAKDCTMN